MTWIQGGPYYELSFLINNSEDKIELLRRILDGLVDLPSFEIRSTAKEIAEEINNYEKGQYEEKIVYRTFEIKAITQIAGKRKVRLHITELSNELIKVNFWFYGSLYDAKKWDQKGIKMEDKPYFKDFFNSVKSKLDPLLGTIAYEEDSEELFATEILSPNEFFIIKNLNLQNIRARLNMNRNEYEYFWVDKGVIENNREIEIIIEAR